MTAVGASDIKPEPETDDGFDLLRAKVSAPPIAVRPGTRLMVGRDRASPRTASSVSGP